VVEFDPKKPSVARVYDALIGGKDHFGPDREIHRQLDAMSPNLTKFVAENKDFLERAVTHVAGQGVGQFIDLGAGIPRPPTTHETAREVIPDARVAYVDDDPQVLAHLTAWYGSNDDLVTVVKADLADHDTVLRAAGRELDLSRPCGLILGMILHFYPADQARSLVAAYLDAAAPGSYLIASSVYSSHERAAEFWAKYSAAVRPIYPHPPEVFASFFGATELVPPGVGETRSWRPDLPSRGPLHTTRVVLCAVGRTG
jgi:O-methyltransferase involved in polyketide biosynthesis